MLFNACNTIPDNHKHYFAVYYIKNTDEKAGTIDSKSARRVWSEHTGSAEGTRRIYTAFQNNAKSADNAEKKDEDEIEKKEDEPENKNETAPDSFKKMDEEKKNEENTEKKDEKPEISNGSSKEN